jgi:glutaredoxin
MKPQLLLYTRKDCCLCAEMKEVIRRVAGAIPLVLNEIAVDGAPELEKQYGEQVPVLFIDGRKAFKHRVTARELQKRLSRTDGFVKSLARTIFGRA